MQPLLTAYNSWIDAEEAKISDPAEGLTKYEEAAKGRIANCRKTFQRIEAGTEADGGGRPGSGSFCFMNRAMWLSTYPQHLFRSRFDGDQPNFDKEIDMSDNRRWYPFQIAFILLNLPGSQNSTILTGARAKKPWPTCCSSHGRWQDRSLPGPDGLHHGLAAIARHCRGPFW